jgi:type IV secretion system protein VirB1
LADAVAIVRRYVAAGYSVDIGLGQINSRNLAHLGVSIEQAFEPCTNLGLASRVQRWLCGGEPPLFRPRCDQRHLFALQYRLDEPAGFANGYVAVCGLLRHRSVPSPRRQ